ncbi:uncharacterized protein PADG_02536 [Paracoccidioides brasiliensis Pb18]|uniref:Uncharacterized protein n=1 Tax=Paracoccidioides brasiliensis (strain Pb18) TaxID=502780 RepID=C1G5T1_PARBD|nr:uncharacterized protein PADG_02536 [Paracoccidioides brasiliensis Pb18]EEH46438.1 hypothetical protein PADG_02536 [Paracoccidioides brasiliensis Pb18]
MQQHQEQNQNQNHRQNYFPVSLFNTTTTAAAAYNLKLPDPPPPPSTSTSSSPVTPPNWLHQHHSNAPQASLDASTTMHRTSLIRLEDHTEDPANEASKGLWARSVTIDDYVVVGGKGGRGMGIGMGKSKGMGIGGFGVGAYSEFDDLRSKLAAAFPYAKSALPQLPPKSAISPSSWKRDGLD